MPRRVSIRPVAYESSPSTFEVVSDLATLANVLYSFADRQSAEYLAAARSCLAVVDSSGDPEIARADFIIALKAVGLAIRDD